MTVAAWPENYAVLPYATRYSITGDLIPSGGTVVRCAKAIDASVAKAGASSLRVTPDGTGTAVVFKNLTSSTPMNLSSGRARVRFYWPYKSGNRSMAVVLSNGTDTTNAQQFSFNSNILREGWNYLWLPLANPNPSVKPLGYTYASFGTGYDYKLTTNAVQFQIEGSPTVDDIVYFDSIDTGPRARCKIVLGFDSADAGCVANALPVIDGYGWTAYNAMSAIYCDAGQLANLATCRAAGWHTLNHSYSHTSYVTLGTTAAEADWRANDAFLRRLGLFEGQPELTQKFFAYAENATSAALTAMLESLGVISARESRNSHCLTDDFGVDNVLRIGSIGMGSGMTLAQGQGHVGFAVSQGTTLFIFGHDVVASPTLSTEWSTADFTALMATIRGYERQGLLDVVSWYDWYLGLTQPALAAA